MLETHPPDHPDPALDRRPATWPYSRGWGYYPTGGIGRILLIILILLLMGRI